MITDEGKVIFDKQNFEPREGKRLIQRHIAGDQQDADAAIT